MARGFATILRILCTLCLSFDPSSALSNTGIASTKHSSPLKAFPTTDRLRHDAINPSPCRIFHRYRHAYTSDPITRSNTELQAVPLPDVWLTSMMPPFLGMIKSEYGVSFGYGFAVAFSAFNMLYRTAASSAGVASPIVAYQAAALIFFGLRLNIFLFIRTRLSQRMKDFEQSIEERAKARGSRAKRLPFIMSCGFLYYCLICPLILTSQLPATNVPTLVPSIMKLLVTGQWFGYLLAAIGDLTKTYEKVKNKDENYLVTEGVFSKLRHPNYIGEIVAWTCNASCGVLAGAYILRTVRPISSSVIVKIGSTAIGWIGIVFVLLRATTNLEKKQKENYGDLPKYQEWVSTTWSGWTLQENDTGKTLKVAEQNEFTMDSETDEESGSGI